MKKRRAYPVFIKQGGEDYLVYVPDLGIYTEGKDFENAIEMARDAISLKCVSMEDHGETLPERSDSDGAIRIARENADEIFDYSDGVLTFVDVELEEYRSRLNNKAVKKNCTIPYWLNEAAEKADINYSRVLQEALMQKLGMA